MLCMGRYRETKKLLKMNFMFYWRGGGGGGGGGEEFAVLIQHLREALYSRNTWSPFRANIG